MFRKMRGIRKSYIEQGLIYFTCQNYNTCTRREREKIEGICMRAGGADYAALFEVITTRRTIKEIAERHHVSESGLYRMRKKFYEWW